MKAILYPLTILVLIGCTPTETGNPPLTPSRNLFKTTVIDDNGVKRVQVVFNEELQAIDTMKADYLYYSDFRDLYTAAVIRDGKATFQTLPDSRLRVRLGTKDGIISHARDFLVDPLGGLHNPNEVYNGYRPGSCDINALSLPQSIGFDGMDRESSLTIDTKCDEEGAELELSFVDDSLGFKVSKTSALAGEHVQIEATSDSRTTNFLRIQPPGKRPTYVDFYDDCFGDDSLCAENQRCLGYICAYPQ